MRDRCLERPDRGKHGSHPTILPRWYAGEENRKSQSSVGSKEHHIMLYDRIALEKHVYVATRTERIQNSKHCVLTLNAEAPQQPLNQRPDFALAKKRMQTIAWHEQLAKTQEEYRAMPSQTTNIRLKKDNIWRTTKNMTSRLVRKQVGGSRRVAGKLADIFVRIVGQPANSFVIVVNVGPKTIGRRSIGILMILQALKIGDIFLRVRDRFSVAWSKPPYNGRCVWTVHPRIQHLQSCTAGSHFITRTGVAEELQSSVWHIFVSLKQLSSTCHFSLRAARAEPDTDHKHKFTLTHFHPLLLPFRRSYLCTKALWFSTLKNPSMFHGRVVDQHKSHLSHIQETIHGVAEWYQWEGSMLLLLARDSYSRFLHFWKHQFQSFF